MTGLTINEQMGQPWVAMFGLEHEFDRLRPRSLYFRELVTVMESEGTLVLRFCREGLEHPTTAPELARVRWEFLSANLGTAGLSNWLTDAGKEPLNVGERRAQLTTDQQSLFYTVSKPRAKFWPFS